MVGFAYNMRVGHNLYFRNRVIYLFSFCVCSEGRFRGRFEAGRRDIDGRSSAAIGGNTAWTLDQQY